MNSHITSSTSNLFIDFNYGIHYELMYWIRLKLMFIDYDGIFSLLKNSYLCDFTMWNLKIMYWGTIIQLPTISLKN